MHRASGGVLGGKCVLLACTVLPGGAVACTILQGNMYRTSGRAVACIVLPGGAVACAILQGGSSMSRTSGE